MPNRILKESITTSDTLPRVSLQAECLFYRLIVRVDDFGRYHGEPNLVYAHCMGNRIGQVTVAEVEAWLAELVRAGLLRRYEAEGRPYVELTTFGEHNPRRASASKFPDPPASGDGGNPPQAGASNCMQAQSDECSCPQAQADECKEALPNADENVGTQFSPYSYSYSYSNSSSSSVLGTDDDDPVDNSDRDNPPVDNSALKKRDETCDPATAAAVSTYFKAFGKFPSPIILQDLYDWLDRLGPDLLVEAMKRTAAANTRSWKYCDTILRNWADCGTRTMADVERLDAEHRARAQNRAPTPAPEPEEPRQIIEVDPIELERARAELLELEREVLGRGNGAGGKPDKPVQTATGTGP